MTLSLDEKPSPTHLAPAVLPMGSGAKRSIFGQLRKNLGWTDEFLEAINDPHHDRLQNLDAMVDALHHIRMSGLTITVLPDFDMDGITSGVIGWAGLSELGFDCRLYIPDYRRGHDITVEAVDELMSQYPGTKAVITCDSGINSYAGVQRIRDYGALALVTDHHVELPPGSNADIAVNPARIGETYAHPGICGAHVLYQVIEAYTEKYAPEKRSSISLLKLFAGIGTVSDVMPILFENRQIVRDSVSIARLLYVTIPEADTVTEYDIEQSILMKLLRSHDHHPAFVSAFEGFAVMLKAFRDHRVPMLDPDGEPVLDANGEPKLSSRKLADITALSEEFYGFYLSPAFNAMRRVGGSMYDAFGVFTAPSVNAKLEHAAAVIAANELRKALAEEHLEQINERDQPLAEYGVFFTDAPIGMLGLIAASLMSESGMPAVVVNPPGSPGEPVSGSARAPGWFEVISTMTKHGFTAIGHEQACGVKATDLDDIVRFASIFKEEADTQYAHLLVTGELEAASRPALVLGSSDDAEGSLSDVEELVDLTECIDNNAPYGHEFPRPEIEVVVDLARCSIQILGSAENHVKIVLSNGIKLLWWNASDRYFDLLEQAKKPRPGASVARFRVQFRINTFMGNTSVQAEIQQLVEATRNV